VRQVHLIRQRENVLPKSALFLSLALLLLFEPATQAAAREPGADIFATNAPVLRIKIEMAANAIRSLDADPRKYVSATIREGDLVLTNVGVHLKGAAGSFRSIHEKPALTLSFTRFLPNQRFHGLRKIHLNNSVQDPSYSTEDICGRMFDAAGVPAPRVTNARVWLNNKDLGFFVVVEGFTRDFLGRYFKNTSGNLYDGGFLREITETLEKESGDETNDQSDLKALAAAASQRDPAKRWQALQEVLDVDRFITYMAMDILMWDWDGYIMKNNNYRVYHDPTSGKMVFLPHGMDQMFWESQGPIFEGVFGGLVARAVIETPQGNRLYRQRLHKLFADIYKLESVTNRFDQLYARNKPAIAELRSSELSNYESAVAEVRSRIIERWHGVKQQLDHEPVPMQFTNGVARPEKWRRQNESQGAALNETTFDGKRTLHIAANAPSMTSWRSKAVLDEGRYRFEAMVRCAHVVPLNDSKGEGAGLRISGTREPRRDKLTGDSEWTKLEFEFGVAEPVTTVELVCELRAKSGEVWFDADSLRLVQLSR
jgi:spore coat protein H